VVLHNPAYSQWITRDQAVLGYILSSLSKETLDSVTTCIRALTFGASSLSSTRHRCEHIVFVTTKKNQLSIAEFYGKMRSLVDDMASTGTPLRDDELVSYILARLDEDYNSMYSAVITRVEPITPSELYALVVLHAACPGAVFSRTWSWPLSWCFTRRLQQQQEHLQHQHPPPMPGLSKDRAYGGHMLVSLRRRICSRATYYNSSDHLVQR
jgi:hypothetical protein